MARRKTHPRPFQRFTDLLKLVHDDTVTDFSSVEQRLVEAMTAFDTAKLTEVWTSGDNQRKGKLFNELIAQLLKNMTGLPIVERGKRPGVLLDNVDVDLCFPTEGAPLVIGETKMLGTPRHRGNEKTAHVTGRRGSADLPKRIREIAFNVIDLKLAAPTGRSTAIGDITTWIQRQAPAVFALFGIRVRDDGDLKAVIKQAQLLTNSYANGVGLFLYRPVDVSTPIGLTTYERVRPPGGMTIDDALRRMAREIRASAG